MVSCLRRDVNDALLNLFGITRIIKALVNLILTSFAHQALHASLSAGFHSTMHCI